MMVVLIVPASAREGAVTIVGKAVTIVEDCDYC